MTVQFPFDFKLPPQFFPISFVELCGIILFLWFHKETYLCDKTDTINHQSFIYSCVAETQEFVCRRYEFVKIVYTRLKQVFIYEKWTKTKEKRALNLLALN